MNVQVRLGLKPVRFLIPSKDTAQLQSTRDAPGDENVQLLIRLHVKHPGLHTCSWETLHDRKHVFYVTTSQNTPFASRLGRQ
jgi:hypothetical protein